MKTETLHNIHVFRVNRVTAKVKEPSSQPIINKINYRTRLSAETKRLICEDHIKNPKTTQEALALKYGCKRTTIAKIIKSKDRWLSIDSDDIIAKRFRQRNSRYPLVEKSLMLWLQNEHSDITLVTDQMIRTQARQYAQEYHLDGLEDFKASSSWVSNFKQKYMAPKSTSRGNKIATRSLVNHETPVLSTTEIEYTEAASSLAIENTTVVKDSELIVHSSPSPEIIEDVNEESFHTPISTELDVTKDAQVNITKDTNMNIAQDMDITEDVYITKEVEVNKMNDDTSENIIMEQTIPRDDNTIVDMTDNYNNQNYCSNPHHYDDSSLTEPESTIKNMKQIAKQHLEAALAFYTSQNEGNDNQSLSANMIKLILQNDF